MMTEEFKDEKVIEKILANYRTVAVVGISDKPERASNGVAFYLQSHGYRIIPVNPMLTSVLGEKAYPDLLSIPGDIEVVDIFRRSDQVAPIVDEAIAKGAKAIWMQEGVVDEVSARKASDHGLDVVMDRCMMKEHGSRDF